MTQIEYRRRTLYIGLISEEGGEISTLMGYLHLGLYA
jgi:hypothetical protein